MKPLRLCLLLAALINLMLDDTGVSPLHAQNSAAFTVTVSSAYLRAAPDPVAPATYSVFRDSTYDVVGRTADSTWVSLAFPAASQGTWIRASFGTIAGSLPGVPVLASDASAEAPSAGPPAAAPSTAGVSASVGSALSLQFTITANSTYARDAPGWQANRIASLFKGQVVRVNGRDGAGEWLRVADTGWVTVGVGQLAGRLADLPIAAAHTRAPSPAVASTVPTEPLPGYVPAITPRMRAVYQQASRRGLDVNRFAVIGDCNSEGYLYMHPLALEYFDLSAFPYLHSTVRTFRRSFFRESLAVHGGFTTRSVLDPLWADPRFCRKGESPYACELRVSGASIAFILLGTGDHHDWQGFEGRYRILIEHALKSGVLPVVVTKADDLESQEGGAEEDYINNVIRRLASEYEVPLFDMGAATRTIEDRGLLNEAAGNNFHLAPNAIGLHIIGTLQSLYVITQP
jgi:hypothetical protein